MAGIYIHIPFCRRKCIYCDFYSVGSINKIDDYIDAVVNELKLRKRELNDGQVTTLYIGGGTPSLLSIQQLNILITGLKDTVCLSEIEEFTIEVNPDDINIEYASGLKSLGINRVSIGIQSFVDQELILINRRHSAKQALDAVATLKLVGFSNISIDLIYGLPNQSIETWSSNIRQAIELDVNHISAYSLSYEEGTRLHMMRSGGKIKESTDDDYINMHNLMVAEFSKSGYQHYEISNFAKPDKYSKHNSSYWNNSHYMGLGASAHSYDGVVRRFNPNNINKYIESINAGKLCYEEELENVFERYNDCILTRLRTMWGLDMEYIKQEFDSNLYNHCINKTRQFVVSGAIVQDGSIIKLSETGIMISDNIFRELFYVP